ncbi:vesicle-trafficking protein SEC22c isoform X1 [Ovis canadensis]|uniref:vesicle-trafficking protein SEC22c isoform X1 n=1 Tax=Ovis canadensis TaxID=37174 RepID=UPI003750F23E
MSLILFACVVRVRDGLPLSASTDFYHSQDFLESRRRLKTLALRLAQYPGRGSAEGCDFSIHFSSSRDVACMAICSLQCPAAMAFCFLETLWWEFTASYDTTCVGLASRPYAFLEFDNVIQKVKWHFNYVSSTQMDSSFGKIQEELKFQPPVVLTLEDTDVANGVMNGHTLMHLEPAPSFRMEPVTALGILSLILNIMCAALNLIRGIHLAEHSLQVAHEEIGNILAFLIPFVACIFQDQPCQETATRGHTTRFPAQGRVLFCRVIPSAADKIPRKKTNVPSFPDHALTTLGDACSKFLVTVSPE